MTRREASIPTSPAVVLQDPAAAVSGVLYVIRLKPDPGLEFVSPSVEAVLGYRPAELYVDPGLGVRVIDPPDAHVVDQMASAEFAAQDVDFEVRWTTKSGGPVQLVHRCCKQRRDDGSIVVYGVAREMAPGQATQAATESQEILRLAMNHAAIGMCLASPEGRFLRVNPALCRFFARSERELLGLSWPEVTHPDDVAASQHLLAALVAGDDESFRTTKRYLRPDGSVVWGELSVSRLRAPDGSVRVLVGQLVDATTTRDTEQALLASEQRFRWLAENASDVVSLSDPDGVLQWVSPSITRVMGWQPQELIGRRALDLIHPDDLASARAKSVEAAAGRPVRNRLRVRCADGSYRWIAVTGKPVRDDSGALIGRVAGWVDATGEVAAEEALASSQEHYRLLAENASDVVIKTGVDGLIQWISPSVADVLGWRPDATVGTPIASIIHPDDLESVRRAQREALARGDRHGTVEFRVVTADGGWRWVSGVGKALIDHSGALVGGIDALRDIQQERDAREALQFLASHDPLTRTATRDVALSRLRGVLSHRPRGGTHVAVMFIDVDNLKPINDTYGHAAGDAVLSEVAQRISAHIRTDDLIARFGGDEFVVILTAVDTVANAQNVAAKIQQAVEPPVIVGDGVVPVGVSIGIAITAPGQDPAQVLRNADAALYQAKRQGKSRTVTHTPD